MTSNKLLFQTTLLLPIATITWVARQLTGKTTSLAPHSTAALIELRAQARFWFFSDVTDSWQRPILNCPQYIAIIITWVND